jgi:glycine oxidase
VVREDLSARIAPRQAVAALVAALCALGVDIRPGWAADGLADGEVRFAAGRIRARTVVLAVGSALRGLLPHMPGTAVKGQAARIALAAPVGAPMLYADGIYAVPQADGTVAVGSTNETVWDDPGATDGWLDAVLARVRGMCPSLAAGVVVERWAGLRPRGARPDPMLGPLPGADGVFVAGGGFKIGFALAPEIGRLMAGMAAGESVDLPHGFALADHLSGGIRP